MGKTSNGMANFLTVVRSEKATKGQTETIPCQRPNMRFHQGRGGGGGTFAELF
jgi:hypothetical protein